MSTRENVKQRIGEITHLVTFAKSRKRKNQLLESRELLSNLLNEKRITEKAFKETEQKILDMQFRK